MCSFLDPQFKKQLTEEDRRIAIKYIKEKLSEFEDDSEDRLSLSEPSTKRSAWSRILGDSPEEMSAHITMQDKITQEIENNLQVSV